jgi:hypothetical protein
MLPLNDDIDVLCCLYCGMVFLLHGTEAARRENRLSGIIVFSAFFHFYKFRMIEDQLK